MSKVSWKRRATATVVTAAVALMSVLIPASSAQALAPADSALCADNLAVGKTVNATSREVAGEKGPELAVDGNIGPDDKATPTVHNVKSASRWSAAGSDNNAALTIDFAGTATINKVQLYWGNTFGKPYKLQASNDGNTWRDLVTNQNGKKAGTTEHTFNGSEKMRYLKMQISGKSQQWGISLWEIAACGTLTSDPTPTDNENLAQLNQLIPYPQKAELAGNNSRFILTKDSEITASGLAGEPAKYLAETLAKSTGYKLPVSATSSAKTQINYVINPNLTVSGVGKEQMNEAYTLQIAPNRVTITARTASGALWATQSLLQLLGPWAVFPQVTVGSLMPIPAMTIQDGPRYSWRGLMLDPARSFIPKNEVIKLMHSMSRFKMNTLHLHLSDEGWRIDIPNEGKDAADPIDYSQLAKRGGSAGLRAGDIGRAPQAGRTGYYTLDDYREMVVTANKLGIAIVPEIDTPGHTEAALYSIPQLNSENSNPKPEAGQDTIGQPNYSKNNMKVNLDALNPYTYTFMQHVLKILAQNSNNTYLHIGGDEANSMNHQHYLQYMQQILPKVKAMKQTPIVWDEALKSVGSVGIAANGGVVQWWNTDSAAGNRSQLRNDFVAKGGKFIVSNASYFYYPQREDRSHVAPSWACPGGECTLKHAYDAQPQQVMGLSDDKGILGVEGAVWSEGVRNLADIEYIAFPRLLAHAEMGWTNQDNKNWERFRGGVAQQATALNATDTSFFNGSQVTWRISPALSPLATDSQGKGSGKANRQLIGYVSAPGKGNDDLDLSLTLTPKESQNAINVPVSTTLDKEYIPVNGSYQTGRQMNSVFKVYADLTKVPQGSYQAQLSAKANGLKSLDGKSDTGLASAVIQVPALSGQTPPGPGTQTSQSDTTWESTERSYPKSSYSFPGNDGKPHKVTWDNHSLKIDGERLQVWAGEFHPWRIPSPQAWRDVLQKIKAAGFNAVSFYFFWGDHQSEEGGAFNFDKGTRRDIDLLLTMAKEEGLYVIARPGPYVNAEISMGGLPAYMTNYAASSLRSTDPKALAASKSWLKAFNSIAKKHLITTGGGSIIMYQVENELLAENPSTTAFLKELSNFVRGDGINVPLFENDWGLAGRFAPNKAGNPAGKYGSTDFYTYDRYPLGFNCGAGRGNLDDVEQTFRNYEPKGPHFIAEGQGGAFTPWGANFTPEKCASFTDGNFVRQWGTVLAGNGVKAYTYYMIFGGTNWGYTGSPSSGFTSYDYGAGIDEDRTIRKDKFGAQKEIAYYLQANPQYVTSNPVAKPDIRRVSGNAQIRGYQRISSEGAAELSATGNGGRTLGFVLNNTNDTSTNKFTFALDLANTSGVGARFNHDDSDSELKYSTGWKSVKDDSAWKGSIHEASKAGEEAAFEFTGTGIEIAVATGTDHGKFAVKLDDQAEQVVTGWVGTEQNKPTQKVVFSKSNLPAGKHTLKVRVLGQSAEGSTTGGTKVQLDALNVLGASATPWVVVNNNDPAIKYNPAVGTASSWEYATGQNWTSGDYQGDETYSARKGDSYTYDFNGIGIDIIGAFSGNHGIADVYIDGKKVGQTKEEITNTARAQQVLYSVRGLSAGKHTLKVEVTGKPFAGSKGTFVSLDALRVFPDKQAIDQFNTGTSVKDGENSWSRIPQKAGTALTLHGRDALLMSADMKIAGQKLLYTTSQLFGSPIATDNAQVQYLLGVAGDDGETLLRYPAKPQVKAPKGVEVTWNEQYKTLRLNYKYSAEPTDITITPAASDRAASAGDTLRLRIIDRTYAQTTWLLNTGEGGSGNRLAVEGAELARNWSLNGTNAEVNGTTDAKSQTPYVLLPKGAKSASWNGGKAGVSETEGIYVGFTKFIPQQLSFEPPQLKWVKQEGAPEKEIDFDDSAWQVANGTQRNQQWQAPSGNGLVLDSNYYGFYEGSVWYRATFVASSDSPVITLNGNGGSGVPGHGKNPAFMQVWANGKSLGARSAAGTDQSFTAKGIKAGDKVVLAVLVNNLGQNLDWSDNGLSRQNRGLYSATVPAQDGKVTWKIQGAADKSGTKDKARGLYNNGGLYGERQGWYLPGLDDSKWIAATDMHANEAGVTWYRSTFDLNVPKDADVAFRLEVLSRRFGDTRQTRTDHSQALLFVNGWNTGIYIGDIGPQDSFTIPAAFLNLNGKNTAAVAVIGKEADAGPENVVLRAIHLSQMNALAPVNAQTDNPGEVEPETPDKPDNPDTPDKPDQTEKPNPSQPGNPQNPATPSKEATPTENAKTPSSKGKTVKEGLERTGSAGISALLIALLALGVGIEVRYRQRWLEDK